MADKIDFETPSARAERWKSYAAYLESAGGKITADMELKPGSKAFVKLSELSDRLGEVQEKDFQAKQLKQEIDRALASAGGVVGGLLKAFDFSGKSDGFDDS